MLECRAVQTRSLEFVAPDYFMKHIVASEDHGAFKTFYEKFAKEIKLMNGEQKAIALKKVRDGARNNLDIKHAQWAQSLEPYNYFERSDKKMLKAPQRKQVLSFLTRYGIYENFLTQKAQKRGSLWCKIKSYTKDVGLQVVQWTGSLKRTFGA